MPVTTVHDPVDPLMDVVFLHGLDGHEQGTWSADGGTGWPNWLGEDVPEVAVYTVGYDASSSRWFKGRALPSVDRAANLLAELRNKGIGTGKRPVCLVTHSMGGLVAKEMVLQSKEGAINPGGSAALIGDI